MKLPKKNLDRVNAIDIPTNPYIRNGLLIGDEDINTFINNITQNDTVPFKYYNICLCIIFYI